ncbi:MAG: tetratricopeptide repeat protein, partial [Spirochaetota bacterium]
LDPEKTLPRPASPEPPVKGIPAEAVKAAASEIFTFSSKISGIYAESGGVFTFDGPDIPEEEGKKERAEEVLIPSRPEPSREPFPAAETPGTGVTTDTADNPPPGEDSPVETLYGMPGDTLGVTLDGRGWIFTGLAEGNSTGNLSFVSRTNTPRYTDFIFAAEGLGDYLLNFQKQDFAGGSFETKRVAVHIVGREEFSRIVSEMKDGGGSGSRGGAGGSDEEEQLLMQEAEAKRLLQLGRKEEALEVYLSLDRPDDPEILDAVAELAFEIGRYDTAREAWTKNLDAEEEYRVGALIGLTDIALRRNDITALDAYAYELLGLAGISAEEQLYRTGLTYTERERYGAAITFFEAYLENYHSGGNADSVYYLLGTIYEKNTGFRNIERARYCYSAVLDDYPTSSYWDRARERIRYLDRHFFSVR